MGERTVITVADCIVASAFLRDGDDRDILGALVERTLIKQFEAMRYGIPVDARTPIIYAPPGAN